VIIDYDSVALQTPHRKVMDREGKVSGRSIVAERIKSCKIDLKKITLQELMERIGSGTDFLGRP
jgi:hypothetical protein